jgi:sugar O-acyltransferase (sialic acid O-acetyltransferase NeuD family)
MVDVGATLSEIAGNSAGAKAVSEDTETAVRISAKSRRRARELGVDIGKVAVTDGRVRVEDVERFAAKAEKVPQLKKVAQKPKPKKGKKDPVVIIGGGGHASYVIDALQGSGHDVVGCTDAALSAGQMVADGISVIGNDGALEDLFADGVTHAFIGVGGTTDTVLRWQLFEKLSAIGFILPALIHPAAYVGVDTDIGPGVQILANATVGPRCWVGANAIVNQGAVICHDCDIGENAHITPGAVIAADVCIGAGTTIGMAATVLNRVVIGAECLVHNGASVVGDISDNMELDRDGHRKSRKQDQ